MGGSRIFQGREGWLILWGCRINGTCPQNVAI